MKSRLNIIATALAMVLGVGTANASEPLTHDGFMLRLSIGVGYESLTLDDGVGTELKLSGIGAGSSIGIGGMVAPNLAINADIFASSVFSPNGSRNGADLGSVDDTSITLVGIGAGITYWLMPANVYIAGAVGLAQATIDVEGQSVDADWGLGIDVVVGTEFWVGDEWGIGVAGQLIWANVPTVTDASSASWLAFNILFSATYN